MPEQNFSAQKFPLVNYATAELLVFSTGGTIAMQANAEGGVLPDGPGDFFVAGNLTNATARQHSHQPWRLVEKQFANLPSPHLTLQDMLRLSTEIDASLQNNPGANETLAKNQPQQHVAHISKTVPYNALGAVVLHGTDTMTDTAFLLDLTLKTEKPVVICGSMRHRAETGYDGPRNLQNAAAICLAAPKACEVLLTMDDEIYSARTALKTNSLALNCLSSPAGPLGRVMADEVIFYHPPKTHTARLFDAAPLLEKPWPKVFMLSAFPGMSGDIVDHLVRSGVQGLVIEAFGAGNLPPDLALALKDALTMGVSVVIASRCPMGGARPIYAYNGGGRDMQSAGALLAGSLSATKAFIFLQLALAANFSKVQMQDFFQFCD